MKKRLEEGSRCDLPVNPLGSSLTRDLVDMSVRGRRLPLVSPRKPKSRPSFQAQWGGPWRNVEGVRSAQLVVECLPPVLISPCSGNGHCVQKFGRRRASWLEPGVRVLDEAVRCVYSGETST